MRFPAILTLVLTGAALTACVGSSNPPPATPLPPLPIDLKSCLKGAGVPIPSRALTVGEVERLWAQDRLKIVVLRKCGTRLVSWYDRLRATWR
jgi:hypothetical protein